MSGEVSNRIVFAEKRSATKDRFRMLKKLQERLLLLKNPLSNLSKETVFDERIQRCKRRTGANRMPPFEDSCKLNSGKITAAGLFVSRFSRISIYFLTILSKKIHQFVTIRACAPTRISSLARATIQICPSTPQEL